MKKLIVTLIIGITAAQLSAGEKQKDSVRAAEENTVATTKAAVPAALVGQWQSGSLAAANFYDPSTQRWNEPSGHGLFLIVQANGEYRFGAGEQITSTDYFLYQEGTVAIKGSEIVLSPKLGREYTRDVCVHEDDERVSNKNELQAATLKFKLVAKQADGRGAMLVLINEQGEQISLQSGAQ